MRGVIQNEFPVARFPENKTQRKGEEKTKGFVSVSLSEPLFPCDSGREMTVGDTLPSRFKDFEEGIFYSESLSLLKKEISLQDYNLLYDRFCSDITLEEIGDGLSISKGGTGKKIQILVEKSRKILARRGITSAHC